MVPISGKQRGKKNREENKMELFSQGVIKGHPSCGQYEDEMSKRFLGRKACERNSRAGGGAGGRRDKAEKPTDCNEGLMWSKGEREGRKGWWVVASSWASLPVIES